MQQEQQQQQQQSTSLLHTSNQLKHKVSGPCFTESHISSLASPDFTLNSPHSSFLADLKPSIIVRGTFQLLFAALPPILTLLALFAQNYISTIYIRDTNDSNLITAFSIGSTFMNIFGFNIMYSFNANLLTLFSQAYGARDPFLIGVHFQRATLFQFPLFLLSYLLPAIYSATFLPYLSPMDTTLEGESLLATVSFVRWSGASVLFFGLFEVSRMYLCGQNHFNEALYARLIGTGIHWALARVLVKSYGLTGILIARNVSEGISIIVLYMFIAQLRLTDWKQPSLLGLTKWSEYSKFILPGGLAVYLQLFYVEYLQLRTALPLTAAVSFVNLRSLVFAIPIGTAVSVTSFVGQSIGEHAKKKAQTAALIGIIACTMYFFVETILWAFLSSPINAYLAIGKTFSSSNSAEEEGVTTENTLTDGTGSEDNNVAGTNQVGIFGKFEIIYVVLLIFVECHQNVLTAIMQGLGMLARNLRFYALCYYAVGVVIAQLLGSFSAFSPQIVWILFLVQNILVCLCQTHFLFKSDWNDIANHPSPIAIDNDIELPLITPSAEHDAAHRESQGGTKLKM